MAGSRRVRVLFTETVDYEVELTTSLPVDASEGEWWDEISHQAPDFVNNATTAVYDRAIVRVEEVRD